MSLQHDPDFLSSSLYQELLRAPLGFIDVGARGGVQPFADPIAELTAVMAFEPDPAGAADLARLLGTRWKQAVIEQTAIGGHNGQAPFYLCAHGVNHSLLPVSPPFRDRYGVASLAERGTITVDLRTLDEVLFHQRSTEPYWGELLKLDVQGAELDILRAAPRTLAERTVAIVAEVCFLDLYQGQPHFSELEQFMASQGFSFYGFLSLQGWSQKFLDKTNSVGRERICFGDALFLRDPLPSGGGRPLGERSYRMLYLCALLFGFYDFAIELAAEGDFSEDEAERLIRLAQKQASYDPQQAIIHVQNLLQAMTAAPERALIELGRFVSERKTLCEVADADVPRRHPLPKANRT